MGMAERLAQDHPKPISFTVPGAPVPKARARVGKFGAYTPARTKAYEAKVQALALMARQEAHQRMWTGPVNLEVRIYADRVEVAAAQMEGEARTSGADLDNILKSIKDGLQGVIFRNDRQVEYLTVRLMK